MTRCKPGDLAMVVNARMPVNDGAIVEVVRRFYGGVLRESGAHYVHDAAPMWAVRSLGRKLVYNPFGYAHEWGVVIDGHLRPIRPSEGDDESLTWAGKPATEPVCF